MKKLLLLFIAIAAVSCSNSTGPEPPPFEPHDFGAWFVKTPNTAAYQGIESQSANKISYNNADIIVLDPEKIDTLVITNPKEETVGDIGISATNYKDYELAIKFAFRGIDYGRVEKTPIPKTQSKNEGKVHLTPIGSGWAQYEFGINFGITYHPNKAATGDYSYITVFDPFTNEAKLVIKIYTAGLDSTVSYMLQYQ